MHSDLDFCLLLEIDDCATRKWAMRFTRRLTRLLRKVDIDGQALIPCRSLSPIGTWTRLLVATPKDLLETIDLAKYLVPEATWFAPLLINDARPIVGSPALGTSLRSDLQRRSTHDPRRTAEVIGLCANDPALKMMITGTTQELEIGRELLIPLVYCVQAFAYAYGCSATNSIDRIAELCSIGILDRPAGAALSEAIRFALRLQLRAKAHADDDVEIVELTADEQGMLLEHAQTGAAAIAALKELARDIAEHSAPRTHQQVVASRLTRR